MQRIGLIGVGNIGSYFARRLREAGYPLTVLDAILERVAPAVELGAEAAASPAEVARRSDIVLLSLPGSPPVEAVMSGHDGLLSALSAGQLVIDTGTTRPATDALYARLCDERGAALIDAPITWRAPGLIFMVGGTTEHFEQGREVLQALAYKLRHIGPVGAGQVLKLMNQMILAGQLAAWAETVEFGRANGADPALLSEYLEFAVPDALLGDDFAGGGQLALHYKDLGYALEVAHDSKAATPITSVVHEIFKACVQGGDPLWTQPGIVTYWCRLNERH